MIGDALGDCEAAEKNGVYFYPILVNLEKESWQEFIDVAFDKLLDNDFGNQYQQKKIKDFYENLNVK